MLIGNLQPHYCIMNQRSSSVKIALLYLTLSIYMYVANGQPVQDTLPAISSLDTPVVNSNRIEEQINSPDLKTVQLNRTDLQLAYPLILLQSEDALILSFDDLKSGMANYYYTFEYCDQKWEPSGLTAFDYLDGFEENPVSDYALSFGTSQHYTHYSVTFPNDDVQFKLSGNYVIRVWKDDDRDTPVIVKRFFVWEESASAEPKVYRPNRIEFRNQYQEVNFTIDIRNLGISNPFDEVRVTLLQNGRFDNALYDLKPRMVSSDQLIYDNDDIVFKAGREYRRFDTKTLKFQSDRIRKIVSSPTGYDVYVNADDSRLYQQYFYEKDINGQYVINADLANNVNTESDYAQVHFVLKYPYFISDGEFYVYGDLSDRMLNATNKMTYDFDLQQYTATLYLKQGYYNYMYAFVSAGSTVADFNFGEGDHFETENDYILLIYHHEYDRNYDRLIGCSVFNSMTR